MKDKYPKTFEYLLENKVYLENRERGRMKGSNWYAYIYPKNIEVMKTIKILVPDIANRAQFALDETGKYAFTSGYGITISQNSHLSMKFILGMLNRKLLNFFLKQISTPMQNGFFRYFTQFIEQLPIPALNFSDQVDVNRHDRIVSLVELLVNLHKSVMISKTPMEKIITQRQIAAIDHEINSLVYSLYNLTPKEIQIVDSSLK